MILTFFVYVKLLITTIFCSDHFPSSTFKIPLLLNVDPIGLYKEKCIYRVVHFSQLVPWLLSYTGLR